MRDLVKPDILNDLVKPDILSSILSKLSMYSSEAFGRLFWVDDNLDFKSCPQNIDGTGDFDSWDYVSEWTDWEGVNMDLLFNIHKTCLHSKQVYSNSLSLKGE